MVTVIQFGEAWREFSLNPIPFFSSLTVRERHHFGEGESNETPYY